MKLKIVLWKATSYSRADLMFNVHVNESWNYNQVLHSLIFLWEMPPLYYSNINFNVKERETASRTGNLASFKT